MSINRFARQQWQESTSSSVAVAAPEGFVACPSCMVSGGIAQVLAWQQEIFRIAYELAKASRAAAELASRATTPASWHQPHCHRTTQKIRRHFY